MMQISSPAIWQVYTIFPVGSFASIDISIGVSVIAVLVGSSSEGVFVLFVGWDVGKFLKIKRALNAKPPKQASPRSAIKPGRTNFLRFAALKEADFVCFGMR